MYVLTSHATLLAVDGGDGRLTQVRNLARLAGRILVEFGPEQLAAGGTASDSPGMAITSGPLAGYSLVPSASAGCFHLFNGAYLCALPNLEVVCDRRVASSWETFKLISREAAETGIVFGEADDLAARVQSLIGQQRPVCLHFGCGDRRITDFLNIDKYRIGGCSEDYYIFPFTEQSWPIPDASVDFIYSEDFIEHIPQKNQVAFLAESFRVLKAGAYNRINTPCLVDSMRIHSDFAKGFNGVYFGEFDKWGHVALLTRGFISDLAGAIGYRQVFFTAKSRASSPFAVEDWRPAEDRDDVSGNIFVDLLK